MPATEREHASSPPAGAGPSHQARLYGERGAGEPVALAGGRPIAATARTGGLRSGAYPVLMRDDWPFAGRERDLAWLLAAIDSGRSVVVLGEVGICKTRLVQEYKKKLKQRRLMVLEAKRHRCRSRWERFGSCCPPDMGRSPQPSGAFTPIAGRYETPGRC
jgi:AAA ATPase domain